jgi:hypothetical protein
MEPEFPAYNLKTRNIGYMSADGLQQYCKMFFEAGRTPVLVPGADLVTNQFVDFANAFDHQSIVRQARATP